MSTGEYWFIHNRVNSKINNRVYNRIQRPKLKLYTSWNRVLSANGVLNRVDNSMVDDQDGTDEILIWTDDQSGNMVNMIMMADDGRNDGW